MVHGALPHSPLLVRAMADVEDRVDGGVVTQVYVTVLSFSGLNETNGHAQSKPYIDVDHYKVQKKLFNTTTQGSDLPWP